MRFVIVGAGAIGATVGGKLALAGREVVLIARGEHARVLADRGLTLRTPDRTDVVAMAVQTDVAALSLRPDDVLVLATKSQDTLPLLRTLAGLPVPALRGRTAAETLPVFSLQNGVVNEHWALRSFRDVYGSCVMLPATRLEPGTVDAHGVPFPGLLDVGRYPAGVDDNAAAISGHLAAAGFLSQPEPEIVRWKYAKLLRNTGNAVEALVGRAGGGDPGTGDPGNGDEGTGDDTVESGRLARAEAERVFTAAGIAWVDDDEWSARRGTQVRSASIGGDARGGGSSWQSLMKGSGSIETDYLNGEVVLAARMHGTEAPVNALLQRLANDAATRGARPGDLTPADLLARLRAVAS